MSTSSLPLPYNIISIFPSFAIGVRSTITIAQKQEEQIKESYKGKTDFPELVELRKF